VQANVLVTAVLKAGVEVVEHLVGKPDVSGQQLDVEIVVVGGAEVGQ
jgi:hypothetical protein